NLGSFVQGPPAPRITRVSPPPAVELQTSSEAMSGPGSTEFDASGDAPCDHWVTINGNHVCIREPQGKQAAQDQQTPQTLAAQIPCHVKAAITGSIKASNSPTADDKKGGFHEEGGQWIITADGKTIPLPAKPGPANPSIEGGAHVVPSDAVDPSPKGKRFQLG